MTAVYTYIKDFILDHDKWFVTLLNELDWIQREGAPRREYWTNFDDRPYTYGRGRGMRTYEAQPSHRLIENGRALIHEQTGFILEGMFANHYGSSRNWLGWHADDDPGIDHTKPIGVITLGQGRIIQFREVVKTATETEKAEYGPTEDIMLESGSLLLMHAGCQFTHEHRIPKAAFEAKARISLTYRGLTERTENEGRIIAAHD